MRCKTHVQTGKDKKATCSCSGSDLTKSGLAWQDGSSRLAAVRSAHHSWLSSDERRSIQAVTEANIPRCTSSLPWMFVRRKCRKPANNRVDPQALLRETLVRPVFVTSRDVCSLSDEEVRSWLLVHFLPGPVHAPLPVPYLGAWLWASVLALFQ